VVAGNKLVGQLIQELRKQQNITGSELGRRVAMSQSKISKLENGMYPKLRFQEIERILNILNVSNSLRRRIYTAMDAERSNIVRFRPYDLRYSTDMYERDRKCVNFRIFAPFIVPALLQTNEYRLALLRSWGAAEDDVTILRAITKRQELLWDRQRRFHFIMHQSMLYGSLPGQRGIGLPQLDRIERFIGLPNIKIGIIPLESGMPLVEVGPFAVLDERILVTITLDGDTASTDSKSIALHGRVFEDMSRLAVYGDEARRLMKAAIN
jgi:transcriptional regulator with XRE-family HTH domain